MQARLSTRIYIACPNCGEGEHRVDHLFGDRMPASFGPWYCDECSRGFRGKVNAPDDIELELTEDHCVRTLVMVELEPQEKSVFFVVEGMRWPMQADRDEDESNRYFYEEHTCPTNFIRCERIISDGDTDPHGLFNYVAAVDRPQDYDEAQDDGDGYWRPKFPQAFGPAEQAVQPR